MLDWIVLYLCLCFICVCICMVGDLNELDVLMKGMNGRKEGRKGGKKGKES